MEQAGERMEKPAYEAPDHIMWKTTPNGVVLLNVNTGEHYRLNETGAVVFGGVVQGMPIEEIAAALTEKFNGVAHEAARGDVEKMIDYLVAEGCIMPPAGREAGRDRKKESAP